ncbi:hypothetical protein B0T20DRAFT_210633 [Sordaria brevicollis]|uniref:Uncharacterized protein n=1 Tax=Sordaria brevicollis TaxID=83679 RepID=A0AAE0UBY5_SORBR|nr:hypothetical protein B0T20DRAFT_210633 [Sordaria brevicollis]
MRWRCRRRTEMETMRGPRSPSTRSRSGKQGPIKTQHCMTMNDGRRRSTACKGKTLYVSTLQSAFPKKPASSFQPPETRAETAKEEQRLFGESLASERARLAGSVRRRRARLLWDFFLLHAEKRSGSGSGRTSICRSESSVRQRQSSSQASSLLYPNVGGGKTTTKELPCSPQRLRKTRTKRSPYCSKEKVRGSGNQFQPGPLK